MKATKFLRSLGSISLLCFATAVFAQTDIKIGDPAPPINASRWLLGQPVTQFNKGTVYVVEFWSTWCGPCKDAMPHLSELAKQYQGKVVFIGADVWEKPEGSESVDTQVDNFIKGEGKTKMHYNVCQDTANGFFDKNWLRAAGQNGIPASFLIDQSGNVVWIGHPMSLAPILAQVVAGTYDDKPFAEQFEKQRASEKGISSIVDPIKAEFKANRYEMVVNLADRALQDPSVKQAFQKQSIQRMRCIALAHVDEQKMLSEFKSAIDLAGSDWFKRRDAYWLMAPVAVQPGLSKGTYEFFASNLAAALMDNPYQGDNHTLDLCTIGLARASFYLGDAAKAEDLDKARMKQQTLLGWQQLYKSELTVFGGGTGPVPGI